METGSPQQLRENLETVASALGFARCTVAPASRARHADLFLDWVAEEKYGDMAWLARNPERRTDPREVLPSAKSVIVLATNYFQGKPPSRRSDAATGTIARYAWGDDYHDLITGRLRDLDHFLAEAGGTQKPYVDTGPVLERDFASESGLGWGGKSTLQIDRQLGTWFFLSVILTTLEITSGKPEPDRCGSCTRCITACPTDAITAPHRLDARRCISYLTIEHKGAIPTEFRKAIGDKIYGCDDCLTACPWNRFAQVSSEATFQARDHLRIFALRDYLDLTPEEFRIMFRGSPIKRTGYARFLRNVCVALGNVGKPEDLPALRKSAASEEPLIAEHAQWAIEQIL